MGQDADVGAWIAAQLGQHIAPPFAAIGIGRGHEIIGGWLLNGFNGFNGNLTIYGPGAISRRSIRACYSHLFIDHGLLRVTASTRRDNQIMRDLMPKFGFRFEAVQRRYYGPRRRDDAFTFALFRADALKWIE